MAFGIYIHIPYCLNRCSYCDFHSYPLKNPGTLDLRAWHLALLKEFKQREPLVANEAVLQSIYLGGGSPSLLPPLFINNLLRELLESCQTAGHALAPDLEITLELNPQDATLDYLQGLKEGPLNRLSLGWQSSNEHFLKFLHRRHTVKDNHLAYQNARLVGFNNISLDLIFAIPQQTPKLLERELETLSALEPEHLSIYELTYHPGTLLYELKQKRQLKPLNDTKIALMMDIIHNFLSARHFKHYEISNYARENYEARHNNLYWQGAAYLGLGPSAHSLIKTNDWSYAARFSNWLSPEQYLAYFQNLNLGEANYPTTPLKTRSAHLKLKETTAYFEELTPITIYRERLLSGLRLLTTGIDIHELAIAHPEQVASLVKGLNLALNQGLGEIVGSKLIPTYQGAKYLDTLISLFF